MLPKRHRVSKITFASVFKQGVLFHLPEMSLKILKKNGDSVFSVTVGKSAGLGAVGRNLLRRQGYSLLKRQYRNFLPGHSVIFLIKKKMPIEKLEGDILSLLGRAKLIK